jgi:hypothetical protein
MDAIAPLLGALLGCEPSPLGWQWTSQCLIVRGCSPQPAPVAPCPLGAKWIALENVIRAPEQHLGRPIAIRGALNTGPGVLSTLIMCPRENRCCNHTSTTLMLGAAEELDSSRLLVLESAQSPEQFSCAGDDSKRCCKLDAHGQEVIATGILVRATGYPGLRLTEATVCAPQP